MNHVLGKPKSALSSAQAISTILVIVLMLVAFAYITTSTVNQSQIASLQNQVNTLENQLKAGQTNVTSLQGNLSSLQGKLSSLPVMNQAPTVRNFKVEWTNGVNSQQDRFFVPNIVVNQGDTVMITFVSNDTDAHTFTLESPYDFQINATVPGTLDYLHNDAVFTTNATNNSPGVKVWGTPGNVTATGSFVAKYAGIYEYFCVYHVQLGMFGYLIVLPNSAYANYTATTTTTTTTAGQAVHLSIVPGAYANQSSIGYSAASIKVVIGVNNTVVWTNNDSQPHTVTASDGSFSSGNMNPGDTFAWTFTTQGTYQYHCSYHPWMKATVVVVSQ